MCAFGSNGLAKGRSPDRLDALVWALTDLMVGTSGRASIRRL
jgi:phage terminase large subunit-like protein